MVGSNISGGTAEKDRENHPGKVEHVRNISLAPVKEITFDANGGADFDVEGVLGGLGGLRLPYRMWCQKCLTGFNNGLPLGKTVDPLFFTNLPGYVDVNRIGDIQGLLVAR